MNSAHPEKSSKSSGPELDPRVARTHDAVMKAATSLLAQGGPEALTMDAVVARSGVAKSTLYRHWATRDDLVRAVFEHAAPHIELPDGLGFEDGLRALLRGLAATLRDEQWASLAPALLLLGRQHKELAAIDDDLHRKQKASVEPLLQQGVDEGLLDPSVLDDVQRTIALACGPIVFAGFTGTVPVDDSLADASADQFIAGHAPRSSRGRRRG
jgi:AcrR family transcriptional regulator